MSQIWLNLSLRKVSHKSEARTLTPDTATSFSCGRKESTSYFVLVYHLAYSLQGFWGKVSLKKWVTGFYKYNLSMDMGQGQVSYESLILTYRWKHSQFWADRALETPQGLEKVPLSLDCFCAFLVCCGLLEDSDTYGSGRSRVPWAPGPHGVG